MTSEVQVHPCVCGFLCGAYSKMKRHRSKCELWQNRPDPKGLQSRRRLKTRRATWVQTGVVLCQHCQRRSDHHDPNCVDSQDNVVRRTALEKHGINPVVFEVFLKLLKERYDEPN